MKKKRRYTPHTGNLGGKFLKNLFDLANDLEKEGSQKEASVKEGQGRKGSRGSGKRSKKALKAIELLEHSKENKENDKRSSWFQSIGKKKKERTNSDFSLPDLGSWSNRKSYAEPILNIISDELEPDDMEIGATSKNIPASKSAGTSKNETRAITECITEQKNENIYDTADFIPSEVNIDIESDSDISVMKSDSTSKSDSIPPKKSIQGDTQL
ncbi:unnamed protein product [Mytilus coruscus]|uniref:Uncharacterized protein n=1 Tax=Mytilus coruscus TaxID=42192 RepID=A0A6J8AG10_MYTCO|nr:unnamed protein product [Mytilus coruscus]